MSCTDVAVVGAGPAGAACAAILAGRGVDVVLLDGGHRCGQWPEVLSPEACLTLERLGLPVAALATVGQPCLGIVDAWDRTSIVHTDFRLHRCGIGWVLDRERFDALLMQWAVASGARVRAAVGGARLFCDPLDETQRLMLHRGADELHCRFVIDATGMVGTLTSAAFARRLRYDRLVAVRARLAGAPYPLGWMRLTASSAGWWYIVSPESGDAQAVFLTDADMLPHGQAELESHLKEQFRNACVRLGVNDWTILPPFQLRDSRTTCRRRLWSGRWLPIGDAAFTIDPLSGSGVARAVSAAESAADLVRVFLDTKDIEHLTAAAVTVAANFSSMLAALRDYYYLAAAADPVFNGPFWQRRVTSEAFRRPL
ncbi:MAG: NAD(P)/FAD-dependent oxidoreductase [Gemmataceae bacterium]